MVECQEVSAIIHKAQRRPQLRGCGERESGGGRGGERKRDGEGAGEEVFSRKITTIMAIQTKK